MSSDNTDAEEDDDNDDVIPINDNFFLIFAVVQKCAVNVQYNLYKPAGYGTMKKGRFGQ